MHRLPAGSWDTHCHVFGPAADYPWAEPRTYTPAESSREALAEMHASIGADRAVIVHPACHGYDMRVTLDAIAASNGRHRGIALVPPEVTGAELRQLHAGGIRGVRFNYAPALGPVPSAANILSLADRIAPLGWHAVFHFDPQELPGFVAVAARLPVPYVIDHLGRIRVEGGLEQKPFATLLDLAEDPKCWIKISGADRASAAPPHYDDTIPFAQALIAAARDRILWGTDFPHPNVKGPVPREADLVALLRRFVPDEALLRRVLIDNPERLYGK
ncbi:amidohydrolase family protein [Sphingomonas soli]|uniref:amidohydrolase family protein n=1 Tax=Sphingomonas soli TaxID=266127 RepID=UPI0008347EE5|nr:amidohydrolase family protein [Sphingomonas soli]